MFDSLLSIVAPHHCYSCGKTGVILCENCKYNISLEYFSDCLVCGGPSGSSGVCLSCSTSYSRGWCVGERSGTLKDIIDSFKFYNNYAAYRDLSTLLSERIGILPRNCIIVPVPTVSSHIRQRGYDHTYLVAKRLAKIQKRPVKQALYGVTSSRQRGENRESRRFQASQAFAVRGTVDPGAVYVLVDDIITTGATLHYAGKALLDAGAHEVWAGVIARQPLD